MRYTLQSHIKVKGKMTDYGKYQVDVAILISNKAVLRSSITRDGLLMMIKGVNPTGKKIRTLNFYEPSNTALKI